MPERMTFNNFSPDSCLRSLTEHANGQPTDSLDENLRQAIEASRIGDVAEGFVLQCQVGNCALECLARDKGIFTVIDETGQAACQ